MVSGRRWYSCCRRGLAGRACQIGGRRQGSWSRCAPVPTRGEGYTRGAARDRGGRERRPARAGGKPLSGRSPMTCRGLTAPRFGWWRRGGESQSMCGARLPAGMGVALGGSRAARAVPSAPCFEGDPTPDPSRSPPQEAALSRGRATRRGQAGERGAPQIPARRPVEPAISRDALCARSSTILTSLSVGSCVMCWMEPTSATDATRAP